MQPNTTLRETCFIASGTGDLACKLIQIILIAVIFCGRMVQSKTTVCLAGRPARYNLVDSMLPMFGWCKQLMQATRIQTNSAMLSIRVHGSITKTLCHFPEAVLQNTGNMQHILSTGISSPSFSDCLRTKVCIVLLLGNLSSW